MFPCASGAPLMSSFLPFSSFRRNIFSCILSFAMEEVLRGLKTCAVALAMAELGSFYSMYTLAPSIRVAKGIVKVKREG